MKYVIRVVGLVDGHPTANDNRFLTRFGFEGCGPGECVLETSRNPGRALKFDSVLEATELWRTVDPRAPVRADGQPNRPLTAYTVAVEPAP